MIPFLINNVTCRRCLIVLGMAKTTLRHVRPDVAAIIDEKHATEKDSWRENRLLAVKLAARGKHISAEIADLCGIARGHLCRWLAEVRKGSLEALLIRDKTSRKRGYREASSRRSSTNSR